MDNREQRRRRSNGFYNDGLAKAQIRDLSGAVISLEKALEFDPTNLMARNLLGLVQYGRGQLGEALAEWILCQNLDANDKASGYFLQKIQSEPDEVKAINISLQKFNQGLRYCREHHVDMALFQLSEAVEINPGLLCAWQLLALIYISRRQYSKARRALLQAKTIDDGDPLTALYLEDAGRTRGRRGEEGIRRESRHAVAYKRGNESIIRPVTEEDSVGSNRIWQNIIIGLILGAAVVFLLIGPLIRSRSNTEANRELAVYTDKIAAQQAQIDALKKELEQYRLEDDKISATDQKSNKSSKASYENLLAIIFEYTAGEIKQDEAVELLMDVNPNALGEKGREQYETYSGWLFPTALNQNWADAQKYYAAGNYDPCIKSLVIVLKMDEDYQDGKAMLMLAHTLAKSNQKNKAIKYYKRIIEILPNTEVAKAAQQGIAGTIVEIDEIPAETVTPADANGTTDGDTTGVAQAYGSNPSQVPEEE